VERFIEQAGDVEVTSAAVVAAVQAYAKINAQDQSIDRSERVDLIALFERTWWAAAIRERRPVFKQNLDTASRLSEVR
jgi:hypothetical protein